MLMKVCHFRVQNSFFSSAILHFGRQCCEFFLSKTICQMKTGQNNKYDTTKTNKSCAGLTLKVNKYIPFGPASHLVLSKQSLNVPYSTLDAKTVDAIKRKCYFRDERTLDYYTNYTRSNCLLECSFKFIKSVCGCVPYYFPSKSA